MSSQVPNSATTIYGAVVDDNRNPDISVQAPITLRPQSVDHSSGYEGHPGTPVPPQGSPITLEPQTLRHRDAPNRGAARDSELDILIASPAIDRLPSEARNEDDNSVPDLMETLLITPEHSSTDRGGELEDVQNREAAHGVDTDFSIPNEAESIAKELLSVDRGDKVVQRGEASSASNTSNQIPSTPKLDVITGGGAYLESPHIIGGGNAFGRDSVVNNTFYGEFTEKEKELICDYITKLGVLPDINDNLKKHVLTQSIISLPRAEAVFNDYQTKKKSGPCFEGTREALLREMADWVISPDESRMYILSGLAGIGKSTVAYTIASRAADLNLLGASFFFSRDEADRNNAKKLFTTIAYQLCVYNEGFTEAIGEVLKTERGSVATTKDPQDQLQALILDPLRSVVQSRARPILVVVDALDECNEDDERGVVQGLSQLVRELPCFKVILTTRPQPHLDRFLYSQGGHKIFRLQDIEDKIVDGDIRVYLNHSLSLEAVQERYPQRRWCAGSDEIDSLVGAAGRLFIIASTAVRYIFDKSASNPAAQMQKLLHAFARYVTPFKDLDHFYTVILRNVVPENCDNGDTVSRYRSVVGGIIIVQRPLPVSTLAHLIDVHVDDIHAVLGHLQSVILLDSDDVPRIYHKSFPDYLTDQARCKDDHLRIDTRTRHTHIATCCFETMDKYLKRNILGLGDPARFMSNEDGLKEDGIAKEQLHEMIPPQLRYACVYWADHLDIANIEDTDLMNGLDRFVDEHMLHWFEVLSLIGQLDLAHHAIDVVLQLLESRSPELHQLLSDALRFISKFYEIIKQSALHTYHSALPFTPSDSPLYRRYIKDAADNLCSVEGGPKKWNALVANLRHGEQVDIIKFSLDSTLFISCSEEHIQGRLKIWDAATGTPISTIPGHRFAVANNFSTVVSSEDKTITFYDMNGSARDAMITTSSKIEVLALSSESSRVAVALVDGTVCLWDSGNAELIERFDGFEADEYRSLLRFSSTGTRLAYSSVNGIVKLWDGISGRSIANLQCGSSDRRYFEFSGDGSRIASLSRAGDLRLWNSESGALIAATSKVAYWPDWPAISANGSLVAIGDVGKVILWSENHGHLTKIKDLQVDDQRSIAFSLHNLLAIGTWFDIKLYNVKTHTFIHTLPFGGTTLVFSPDCTRLAIRDYDNVNLLDTRDVDGSTEGNATAVTALALSRDCSRLACGFSDGRVELWGTSPTKRRIDPLTLRSKVKTTFSRIFRQSRHTDKVSTLGFDPDGRLFASGSDDWTIKLWNGDDGALHGNLKVPGWLNAVALSNNVLVAAWVGGVTLWNLDTLSRNYTFKNMNIVSKMSIAENSTLIAVFYSWPYCVTLLDVVNRTTIATFDVPFRIHTMAFLPDNSQLVVQSDKDAFLSLNLVNKHTITGPILEHLIQLPSTSLSHGVPIWHCQDEEQHYFAALFSQHKSPVPMLWIPRDLHVVKWTQGSSMIALGCSDGRVILLRLPSTHVS